MSLFICEKCGCIENTATSTYWYIKSNKNNIIYDETLKDYKDKYLCSECGSFKFIEETGQLELIPGKWHNLFPKRKATEEEYNKMNVKTRIIE